MAFFYDRSSNSSLTFTDKKEFQINVCNVALDAVNSQMKERYKVVAKVEETFDVLQSFDESDVDVLTAMCKTLAEAYSQDLDAELLLAELLCLKTVFSANFDKDDKTSPLRLLNKISESNMATAFPYICIACRIFCTLPVTVASAECSFSVMARVKNVLRNAMGQKRLTSLGVLAVESEIARSIDYKFCRKKRS